MGENSLDIESFDALRDIIRSIYSGLSSLKVSLGLLEKRLSSLEENVSVSAEQLTKLVAEFRKEKDDMLSRLEKEGAEHRRELRGVIEVFLDRVTDRLDSLYGTTEQLVNEVAATRGDLSDKLLAVMDVCNELKVEVYSLRSEIRNLTLMMADLSAGLKGEISELKSRVHELELLAAELKSGTK